MIARDRLLRRALGLSVLSIVINGIAGGTAIVVSQTSGSLSLLGFGFDAAVDSIASVALVWRFSIEKREPHRAERVEKVAEAVIGAVLLVMALYLGVSAIRALAGGAHPEATAIGTVLLLASVAVLPPLALAKFRVARQLGSRALRADSLLTAVAAVLAAVSFGSVWLADRFGLTWADGVGALIVAAVLSREGWSSIRAMREGESA